jgi:hypothetical protein
MINIHPKLLSLGLFAALGCGGAWADSSDAGCGSVSGVQRKIVERADEGMAPLQGYMRITRGVHAVDMADVAGSLDAWRATVRCQEAVAAAQPSARDAVASAGPDTLRTAGR